MKKLTKNEKQALKERRAFILALMDETTTQATGLNLLEFDGWSEELIIHFDTMVQALTKNNAYSLFFAIWDRRKELKDEWQTNPIRLEELEVLRQLKQSYKDEIKSCKAQKEIIVEFSSSIQEEIEQMFPSIKNEDDLIDKFKNDRNDTELFNQMVQIFKHNSQYKNIDLKLIDLEKDIKENPYILLKEDGLENINKFYKIANHILKCFQQSIFNRLIDIKKLETISGSKTPASHTIRTVINKKELRGWELAKNRTQKSVLEGVLACLSMNIDEVNSSYRNDVHDVIEDV